MVSMDRFQPLERRRYAGWAECAKRIIMSEGLGSLFKGSMSNKPNHFGAGLVLIFYD